MLLHFIALYSSFHFVLKLFDKILLDKEIISQKLKAGIFHHRKKNNVNPNCFQETRSQHSTAKKFLAIKFVIFFVFAVQKFSVKARLQKNLVRLSAFCFICSIICNFSLAIFCVTWKKLCWRCARYFSQRGGQRSPGKFLWLLN